jgi:hypothetical protein
MSIPSSPRNVICVDTVSPDTLPLGIHFSVVETLHINYTLVFKISLGVKAIFRALVL